MILERIYIINAFVYFYDTGVMYKLHEESQFAEMVLRLLLPDVIHVFAMFSNVSISKGLIM